MSAFFFGNITVSRDDFFAPSQTVSNLKQASGLAHTASPKTSNLYFENSNFYQVAAANPKIESPTCSKNISACPSEMIDESDFISFDFCLNAPLIKKSSSIVNSKEIEVSEFTIREEGANNNISYTPNFSQSSIDISDFSL